MNVFVTKMCSTADLAKLLCSMESVTWHYSSMHFIRWGRGRGRS